MDFEQVLSTRRSIRSFRQDAIPQVVLLEILSLARLAPSAANKQPWRFLLLQSREWLDKAHAAYPRSWFMDAPSVLVITGSQDLAWTRLADSYNSIETDLAIVMDHVVLAAWARGIGSCWIANFEPDVLRKNLGLGLEEKVFAMTPLGYPAETLNLLQEEKARKKLEDILFVL